MDGTTPQPPKKEESFPVSVEHMISEMFSGIWAFGVILIQSIVIIRHYRNSVPFKQMTWAFDQILSYIMELAMVGWASKYLVSAFLCIENYELGVKLHLCAVEYKKQPPKLEPVPEEGQEENF